MRFSTRLGIVTLLLLTVGLATLVGWSSSRDRAVPAPTSAAEIAARRSAMGSDGRIADLQAQIDRQPDRASNFAALASAYIQKVRENGDYSLYTAAEAAAQKARALDPEDDTAIVLLAALAAGRHEFNQALSLGEQAKAMNAYKAAAYGIIGDAQIELGRYDEAIAIIQQMVDLRPDQSSYARVSYVRELQGDMPGAISVMRMALEAGVPGTEASAWTRVQLGHLYFNSGNLPAAEREYRRTLLELPDYVYARGGIARVKAARGEYTEAAAMLELIVKQLPLPEFAIALADVYRAWGKPDEMAQAVALVGVINRLQRANGVNTDLEMALFEADYEVDLAGAIGRVQQAQAARPNIFAWDALAWTLYKNGRYEEAMAASEQALRFGTRNALMQYHAGMIALKLGLTERAGRYLREAVEQNPYFSLLYAADARRQLDSLASLPR